MSDPKMNAFHAAVNARDGKCFYCQSSNIGPAHHLIRRRFECKHDPRIGVSVCPGCHSKMHMGRNTIAMKDAAIIYLVEKGVWPSVEAFHEFRRKMENGK